MATSDESDDEVSYKRRKFNSYSDENESPAIQDHIPHNSSQINSFHSEDSSNDSAGEQQPHFNYNQSDWSANSQLQETNESSSDEEPVVQKEEQTEYPYSSTSLRMMQKMGYVQNTGLGKSGQGRLIPVQANAQQKGRRGLGLQLDGLEKAALQWNPSMEKTTLTEPVVWLVNEYDDVDIHELDCDLLKTWVVKGKKKMTIEDETNFCDPLILKSILDSKTLFDNLSSDDMCKARSKSNPFEVIRQNIFLNRAAVKLANIDYMFDFMFTNPVNEENETLVKDDLLYFADVCAGPGGFTEYILWKKGWHAKGFGFTLKGECDFKLDDFYAGPPESFEPYYGIKDDGNVYDPENIESFAQHVLRQTSVGVHFMMADGGFSCAGQENVQEVLSKQLYLCQCLVALSIIRKDGHFVVKLFDIFTQFSVGLIYFMYRCFKQISICKPNSSRPANSERYLVCKWKKANTDIIQRHLFSVNEYLWKYKDSGKDIIGLVPLEVINVDPKFSDYIYNSNNDIGQNQIIGLLKIAAFAKDSTLHEPRQAENRLQCLKLWQLPDSIRRAPPSVTNDVYFNNILEEWSKEREFMSDKDKFLMGSSPLDKVFESFDTWYFVPFEIVEETGGKSVRTFFMSKGGRDVWRYNANSSSWSAVRNVCLELSPKTLLYGEICPERQGEGRSQITINALHIIDAIMLGGTDIRRLPLTKRNKMCQKFAKSLTKPMTKVKNKETANQEPLIPIRCKRLFKISELSKFFTDLDEYTLKDGTTRLGFKLRNEFGPERFFIPKALMFMRELRSDYMKMYSKSTHQYYYFNKTTRTSHFLADMGNIPLEASFKNTFNMRQVWKWEYLGQINQAVVENIEDHRHLLFRSTFESFVDSKQQSSYHYND